MTHDARILAGKKVKDTDPADGSTGPGVDPGPGPGDLHAADCAKVKDAKTKTHDAKAVEAAREDYFDVLSRAEILVPGMRFPTFDSNADPKLSADRLCAFRRRVVDAALQLPDSKEAVETFYNGKTPIKSMTCDAIEVLFRGASDKMRDRNNEAQPGSHKPGSAAIRTIADINRRNREIWKR